MPSTSKNGGGNKMIARFNCLRNYPNLDIAEAIYNKKNALAWFAGEEVARSYVENMEEK